ncbi:cytosolic sulfotransferase 1-like isoform X2 [Antennarius striatus]
MEFPPRQELFDFHGVSMTQYVTSTWERVQTFKARPDDILIVTYPKAGTTWVSYILDLLYFGQTSPERLTSIPIYDRVPFLEFSHLPMHSGSINENIPTIFAWCITNTLFLIYVPSCTLHLPLLTCLSATHSSDCKGWFSPSLPFHKGVEQAENLSISPRIIKTHLPVQFIPKSFWEQNCKIFYVARNAKDNVVSYFHFDRMLMIQPDPGDWNSYLKRFMEGKVLFGSWYDHVNGWWKKKQTYSNLHYMFYEDMTEDTEGEIDKLCSFLGLSPSVEEKKQIRGEVHFDSMKKNNMANYSSFPTMDFKISKFMRKGKVGDWKNHFTVAQNEEFDEDYKNKMKDPTLQFRTEI